MCPNRVPIVSQSKRVPVPSVDITNATLRKAKADARPGGERYEISDARQRGLSIRVGATGAKWQIRWNRHGRGTRLDIGSIDDWTITEAREMAAKALNFLRTTGIPDVKWVQNRRVEYRKVERTAPVRTAPVAVRDLWTFEVAKEKYLDEVKRIRREATWVDYKNMLGAPELDILKGRFVADIKRVHLAMIVAKVHSTGRERHSEHLASVLRPMWKFLGQDAHIRRSGIEVGVMIGLKAPPRTLVEDDGDGGADAYVPPLLELGRVLSIARAEGVLAERIGLAVQLTVHTAQRILTIASAKVSHFEEVDGGGLWTIPPLRRKAGTSKSGKARKHVIPLPPSTWSIVKRAIEIAGEENSVWLFPGFRPKKAGDEVKHLSKFAITTAFRLMPEVPARPHDVRRSMGTLGESVLGLMRSDTKAILDHGEGIQSGDVTAAHYSLHDGRHFKWPVMQKWVEEVEAQIADAVAEDPQLLDSAWLKAQIVEAREESKRKKKTSP